MISNPSRKDRETDTQFKVSKQNSILDFIDTYRILRKAVFDESRMYGLEGDLLFISFEICPTIWGKKVKISDFSPYKKKIIPLSRSCHVEVLQKKKQQNSIQFIIID
ncbi:hypothetical protein OROGR_005479 [Orobanche gracilis]